MITAAPPAPTHPFANRPPLKKSVFKQLCKPFLIETLYTLAHICDIFFLFIHKANLPPCLTIFFFGFLFLITFTIFSLSVVSLISDISLLLSNEILISYKRNTTTHKEKKTNTTLLFPIFKRKKKQLCSGKEVDFVYHY